MNGDKYILNKGEPFKMEDLSLWAKWFEETDRRVAHVVVGDYNIVTVFSAIDRSEILMEPLLWETLIDPNIDCDLPRHYGTKEEAVRTHAAWVEAAMQLSPPGTDVENLMIGISRKGKQ